MATELNSLRGAKFKPLVKLLKVWNILLPESAKLKSAAIRHPPSAIRHPPSAPSSLLDGDHRADVQ